MQPPVSSALGPRMSLPVAPRLAPTAHTAGRDCTPPPPPPLASVPLTDSLPGPPPPPVCRYFPTILIVLLAVFNDGAMIALSKDRVTPSPIPNAWRLRDIFIVGIVYGLYLTLSTWVLYHVRPRRRGAQLAGWLHACMRDV